MHLKQKCIHFWRLDIIKMSQTVCIHSQKGLVCHSFSPLAAHFYKKLDYQNLFEERQIASVVFVSIYEITLLA